jgi:hypothetical protein
LSIYRSFLSGGEVSGAVGLKQKGHAGCFSGCLKNKTLSLIEEGFFESHR